MDIRARDWRGMLSLTLEADHSWETTWSFPNCSRKVTKALQSMAASNCWGSLWRALTWANPAFVRRYRRGVMGQESEISREERGVAAPAQPAQKVVSADKFLEYKPPGAPSGDPALRRWVRDSTAPARPRHRGE